MTNNPVLATHVVTSKLRRTLKLIAAMNVCEYVVTPLWVEACLRQSKLLPVKDEFLLQDPEGESVYCCSIQESLKVVSLCHRNEVERTEETLLIHVLLFMNIAI